MTNAYSQAPSVVALLGPDGAGKSTLARAITDAAGVYDRNASLRAVQVHGRNATVADIRLPRRTCQVVDFADAETEAAILGASPVHGAILVVSAADSILPGHKASLARAHELRIPILAVALTKCDAVGDIELVELVTMEIRELLSKCGLAGETLPVVLTSSISTRPTEGRARDPDGPSGAGALVSIFGA